MPGRPIRVSYLLSTRNRAPYLANAFANLRQVVTPEDEIIVADGASTDQTAEVIRENRDIVSHFISEPDLGEAHGYNKGILLAKGKFLKFITDDDYVFPEGMRAAIQLLEENIAIDAILCGGESFIFEPSTKQKKFRRYIWLPPHRTESDGMENVFGWVTCGLGLIFRRRIIAQVGLLDTSFVAVDIDFMARLLAHKTQLFYAGIKLFRHTEYPHSGQLRGAEMHRDRLRIIQRMKRWDLVCFQGDENGLLPAALEPLSCSEDGLILSQWLLYLHRIQKGRLRAISKLLLGALRIGFQVRDMRKRASPDKMGAYLGGKDGIDSAVQASSLPGHRSTAHAPGPTWLESQEEEPAWDNAMHRLQLRRPSVCAHY